MLLGDMLGLLGNSPISQFAGAIQLVQEINQRLPSTAAMTTTNTGKDFLIALNQLSTSDRVKMLMGEVNMSTGELTLGSAQPAVPVPPRRTQSLAAVVFAGVLVFIALMLASAVTYNSFKSGQPPDSKSLDSLGHVVGDVVDSLNKANQSQQQNNNQNQ